MEGFPSVLARGGRVLTPALFSTSQNFHDGRKAQQHIETCWKQLESVSGTPATKAASPPPSHFILNLAEWLTQEEPSAAH